VRKVRDDDGGVVNLSTGDPPPFARGCYDELPDAVIVVDSALAVLDVNPAAERLLREGRDRLIGQDARRAIGITDDRGRDWWDCLALVDGLASRIRQPERLLTLSIDGADCDVLVTASFVRGTDRLVHRLVVCIRDTSARSRMERSGAELVSTVAHELRSPLTSVKGFTATLLAKWDRFDDDQRRHMLATVNSDADRVTRLISELLDVSRIESGRLELRKQVVDINAIVRRDIAARVASGESEARFVVQEAGELGEIWADPDKIAQVIGNLVENGLRHGAGTVSIVITPDGDGVALTVTDKGEGIAPEAANRVFRKFWRGSARRGTGLGLFIAKGIVDAHGGSIEAGRAEGGGARVRFVLPAGTPDFAV